MYRVFHCIAMNSQQVWHWHYRLNNNIKRHWYPLWYLPHHLANNLWFSASVWSASSQAVLMGQTWYPGISGSGRVFHFWPSTNGYISGCICPSQWGLAFGTACFILRDETQRWCSPCGSLPASRLQHLHGSYLQMWSHGGCSWATPPDLQAGPQQNSRA